MGAYRATIWFTGVTWDEAVEQVNDLNEWFINTDYSCAIDDMSLDHPSEADPMDDIPWGTPDSWIPDNPDENGMRQSDFI